MKVSAFAAIKNEAHFIGYGLMSILPFVDEVVYGDGNSTDGTLELLNYIQTRHDPDGKIKVYQGMDFKDLKEDYVRVFNELMGECSGDYLWYCHPDMILTEPGILAQKDSMKDLAYWVNMRSFAGEDLDKEIVKGRTDKWKTLMKNDFGLHYWGVYGHTHEDMYFADITGDEHLVHKDMNAYPFDVKDSGIKISHFCECKPRKRREEKMKNVLVATDYLDPSNETATFDFIMNHPRVHLQNQNSKWGEFVFEDRKDPLPDVFGKYKMEFETVLGAK
jgi:hypothetical protein